MAELLNLELTSVLLTLLAYQAGLLIQKQNIYQLRCFAQVCRQQKSGVCHICRDLAVFA